MTLQIKPLHEIGSMDEYLQNYGKILGKKAITALAPLHVPGRDPLPGFDDVLREPFDCQKHVIAAAVKMMDTQGSGFIVGEMGTGKTLLGMVSVFKHAQRSRKKGGCGGKFRCIVLCPDHLIAKWCREIRETIPDASVHRFGPLPEEGDRGKAESGSKKTLSDTVDLLKAGNGRLWNKPRGPEFYVLGRNQAKWYPDWLGLYDPKTGFNGRRREQSVSSKTIVVDKVQKTDENDRPIYDRRGQPVLVSVTARVFYCPTCGTVVRDKRGTPMSARQLSDKQQVCQGRYLQQIADPEKPQNGLDRRRLPRSLGEKLPGQEVNHHGKKYVVRECKEPLWNWTSRPYRWAPARLIQKKMRRMFQYLIIDEVHEQKSDESAQSMACGKLISSVRHTLALTGTIIGGYASHLYPLMMRLTPRTLRDEGFEWGKDLAFSEVYGRIDRIVTVKEEAESPTVRKNVKSMRRAKSGKANERKAVRPGVMPTMFGRHMIGSSMFITLEELADELPDLFEYIGGPLPEPAAGEDMGRYERAKAGWFDVACDMLPDQKAEYDRVTATLEYANKELLRRGSMKLLGTYLWTSLDYPDRPWGWDHDREVVKAFEQRKAAVLDEFGPEAANKLRLPHTVGFWDKPGVRTIDTFVGVVTPKSLDQAVVYPKEQRLIDICKAQKADGTQTWVYVQMTGKRNIQPRLKALLEREGLRVGVLRSGDVDPKEREYWIIRHGREFDVMISHPQLVSTGLDLFSKSQGGHNYATIVFYETGYNLFTMRQAARRAWRIGQPRDCRVYYLYYRETMQHKAMSLMSRKMAAAQALEGEFSEDGLAAMAGEDNLQMALAKNLAERIDDSDMQRSWNKVQNGPKKKRPTDALKDLTAPTLRTPAPMPPIAKLAALTHPQRQAFKRMAQRPDAMLTLADMKCITETADALVAAGLAERFGPGWRCVVHGEVLKEVLVWFQLSHVDSMVHYPLGVVKARRPGGGEHYVRLTNHTTLSNVIELLPVAGFPMVNSIPRTVSQAEREGWVLTQASEADRAALQASGFFKPAQTSPLDDLPIPVQMVASSLIDSQHKPVPPEAAAEFPRLAEELAALDAAFTVAVTDPASIPETDEDSPLETFDVAALVDSKCVTTPASTPVEMAATPQALAAQAIRLYEPDDTDEVPELTEEILARMFGNMMANGLLS